MQVPPTQTPSTTSHTDGIMMFTATPYSPPSSSSLLFSAETSAAPPVFHPTVSVELVLPLSTTSTSSAGAGFTVFSSSDPFTSGFMPNRTLEESPPRRNHSGYSSDQVSHRSALSFSGMDDMENSQPSQTGGVNDLYSNIQLTGYDSQAYMPLNNILLQEVRDRDSQATEAASSVLRYPHQNYSTLSPSNSTSKEIISIYSNSFDDDGNLSTPDVVYLTDSETMSIQNEPSNLLDKIRFSDIKLGKKIGDGTFGEVFEATLWSQAVAVKIIRIKNEDAAKANNQIKKFQKEVNIMKTLRHPNIVEYMGLSFPQDMQSAAPDNSNPLTPKLCIVTELLPNGNLEQLLAKRKLSWKRYFRFAKDIASGLNWLHHKGIIHRDLKPSNLLVTSSYHIKIADFGLSHMKNNPSGSSGIYSVCGTRCYIAPEVLQKKPYDTKADVFSYGVVLCEMINGSYPFETMDSRETYSLNEMVVSGMRPRMPEECPPTLKRLIERCWDDHPGNRPSMEEILDSLDELEHETLASSQIYLDEELDVLSDEIRKKVIEERLRLGEIQSELYILKTRYQAMQNEMLKSRELLKTEVKGKRDFDKKVKEVSKQRDKWKEQFDALQIQLANAPPRTPDPPRGRQTPSKRSNSSISSSDLPKATRQKTTHSKPASTSKRRSSRS